MADRINLEVLGLPFLEIWSLLLPLLEFWNGEKILRLLLIPSPLPYPHDRGHELNKKIGNLQQRRKEVVQVINEEPFDMRSIVIL